MRTPCDGSTSQSPHGQSHRLSLPERYAQLAFFARTFSPSQGLMHPDNNEVHPTLYSLLDRYRSSFIFFLANRTHLQHLFTVRWILGKKAWQALLMSCHLLSTSSGVRSHTDRPTCNVVRCTSHTCIASLTQSSIQSFPSIPRHRILTVVFRTPFMTLGWDYMQAVYETLFSALLCVYRVVNTLSG